VRERILDVCWARMRGTRIEALPRTKRHPVSGCDGVFFAKSNGYLKLITPNRPWA